MALGVHNHKPGCLKQLFSSLYCFLNKLPSPKEEDSVIVVSLSLLVSLFLKSMLTAMEPREKTETTIERHLETVKILMSWNV